ncbi:NEW3 domain-containing protein [Myxococcaceae bacterium GXIMD 01537]
MSRTWMLMAAALLAACGTEVWPEGAEPAAQDARGLAEATRLAQRVEQLHPSRLGPDSRDAERALEERARALESLAAVDPAAAWARALPEEVRAQALRRAPGAAAWLETRGAWEGELEVLVVDSPSLHELRRDYFVNVGRERHPLHFTRAAPRGLHSGQQVRVKGLRVGQRLLAEETGLEARPEASRQLAGTCSATGEQRTIVILAAFPGQPVPSITPFHVESIFFEEWNRSLTDYWSEVSGGRTWATGDVAGWYTLDQAYGCDDTGAMREAAINAADADVDFTQYERIFIVHPMPSQGCSYAGVASLSCNTVTTDDGPVVASTAWLVAGNLSLYTQGVMLVTHEAGHNLSLDHSSSRDFGVEALGAVGAQGAVDEYGDVFSTMGRWNLGHYAVEHKARLGWLDPGAVTVVDGTDATVTLTPAESSGGVKALKVRRGTGNDAWLWLEYRRPVGNYDTSLGSQAYGGAVVHASDASTGAHTYLLDFTPATSSWSDAPLKAGTTWVDPYSNLSLTVGTATSSGLTVSVHHGTNTCVPAAPEVNVTGWQENAWPGGRPQFEVEVINRDTAGCPPATFQVSALVPAGWGFDPMPSQVTIAPASAAYLDLQTYAPYSTAVGTYTAGAAITRNGQTVQGTATVDIVERCVLAPPTLTFSPAVVTAAPGTQATFSVTLTNHDSASCSWVWYDFASSLPDGWATTLSDSGMNLDAGESFTFTLTKDIPLGTSAGDKTVDLQVIRDEVGLQLTGTATVRVTP